MDDYNDTDSEEIVATAGESLDLTTKSIASEETIIDALHTVYDPEIPVDIYELGLIYDLIINDDGSVDIEMTLTSPTCPVAEEMPGQIARTVAKVSGVGKVIVRLVWDPPWTSERISEDAKLILGFF